MRLTHHLVVLGLLGVMTLTGLGARWGDPIASVAMAAPSPTPIIFGVTQSSVMTSAPAVVNSMTQSGGTTAAPAVPVASPSAVAVVPPAPENNHKWVQNF